jgi:hypothetical protein
MKNNFADQNAVRDATELFLVNHFDTLELAGRVSFSGDKGINYFGIDLTEYEWDKNVEALNAELAKYLKAWASVNGQYFSSYVDMAHVTVEYILPEVGNTIMNVFKNIQLYFLPSHYYRSSGKRKVIKNKLLLWFSKHWDNYLERNTIIAAILTAVLMFFTLLFYESHTLKIAEIGKLVEYTNLASSIMASFLLTFLITKVIAIKQYKMSKVPEIKALSVKLTYFRKLCYNFRTDFNYWNEQNPRISSYNHARYIMNKISFQDYYYPDHTNTEKYAHFKGLYKDDVSHPIVCLILQLYLFSDEDYFHNMDLTYTEYPGNYIYILEELERFSVLLDNNTIWYACEKGYFPEIFPETYQSKEIMKEIARIDPEFTGKPMTREILRKVSLDFQYDIIPRLYRLIKLTEKRLPESITYFLTITFSILLIGIVVPSILHIFLGHTVWSAISSCAILGFIIHILLSLPFLFKQENELDKNTDYI